MHIGKLDQRVTIQQISEESVSASGDPVTVFANIPTNPTVWANVEKITQDNIDQGDRQVSIEAWKITMRARSDVSPANRLVWRSKALAIRSIIPDQARAGFITITCGWENE